VRPEEAVEYVLSLAAQIEAQRQKDKDKAAQAGKGGKK
jgi:hypothetical protein